MPAFCVIVLGALERWLWSVSQGVDEGLRGGEVAEAPTGHRKRLREAVDGERALVHPRQTRKGDRLDAVDDVLVDLIGDDEHVRMAAQDLGEGLHLVRRVDGAGGVVGRVEDEEARPGAQRGLQGLRPELEAVVDARLGHNRRGAGELHHLGVRHPVGRHDHDLVAGGAEGEHGLGDALLGAVGAEDLAGGVREAVVAEELGGNRLAQFRQARVGGVVGPALAHRLRGGRHDGRRRVEVGLAGAQADDGLPGALALVGPLRHRERGRRLKGSDAGIEADVGHGRSKLGGQSTPRRRRLPPGRAGKRFHRPLFTASVIAEGVRGWSFVVRGQSGGDLLPGSSDNEQRTTNKPPASQPPCRTSTTSRVGARRRSTRKDARADIPSAHATSASKSQVSTARASTGRPSV